MKDEVYRNSLKEVYDVLEFTDVQLVNKIPNKFLNFIKENMNPDYETHVNPDIEIDKQPLKKKNLQKMIKSNFCKKKNLKEKSLKICLKFSLLLKNLLV